MKKPNTINRKNSKTKELRQHRGAFFNSQVAFSAGRKRVTIRVPAELRSAIICGANKLNVSVAEFIHRAVREVLPLVEKGTSRKQKLNQIAVDPTIPETN